MTLSYSLMQIADSELDLKRLRTHIFKYLKLILVHSVLTTTIRMVCDLLIILIGKFLY